MSNSSLTNNLDSARFRTMPFGKYEGSPLESIPENYLMWCRDSLTLEAELEASIRQELFDRSTRRLVRLLRESPGAVAKLSPNIADLIRMAERAGYECHELRN